MVRHRRRASDSQSARRRSPCPALPALPSLPYSGPPVLDQTAPAVPAAQLRDRGAIACRAPRAPDGLAARARERVDQLVVHQPAEHHLDYLHRALVRDAPPVHKARLHAQILQHPWVGASGARARARAQGLGDVGRASSARQTRRGSACDTRQCTPPGKGDVAEERGERGGRATGGAARAPEICGPPPCTITTLTPRRRSRTTSA